MHAPRSANDAMHDVIYAALTEGGSLVSVGAFLEWMEGKKLPGVKALEG